MKYIKSSTLLVAWLVVTALCTSPVVLAGGTMKMASATINDVQHQWQKVFSQELAGMIGDEINVEIYPASQLGPIPQMAEGVVLGTIESFISPTAFLVPSNPKFKIYDAPGIFDSAQHLGRTIHDPAYRDVLEEIALDSGLRVIGAVYNSPFVVLTTKKVTSLSGLSGLKIRTFASPLQMEPMKAIGVSPLPLPLSEVVPALQTGAVDGMLAGVPILTAFKFYDISPHVLDLQFSHIISVNVINEDWFQSQSETVKQAIREAGRAAETAVLQWGIDNLARSNKAWGEHGGTIYPLSPGDREEMFKIFKEIGTRLLLEDEVTAGEYRRFLEVVERNR